MCLILFAYKSHPNFPLILAANRDEFYNRPTAPMMFWHDHPQVLAGRDLQALGTWMGITRGGRLAAVTNYREPGTHNPEALSRGSLVADFLTGNAPPEDYLNQIQTRADQYNGFNLLVGDAAGLHYYSNRGRKPSPLAPGIYGLSNHLLDANWPKIQRGKQQLTQLTQSDGNITIEKACRLLQDQNKVPEDLLPDTGVGLTWESILGSIFITSPAYGTRSSTILLIHNNGRVQISEITWQPGQGIPKLTAQKDITLTLEEHYGTTSHR